MVQFEGIIEITEIRNSGPAAGLVGTLTGRFVRYPGSQQLSVWLPEKGWEYTGTARIMNQVTRQVLNEKPVADLLSGPVLLLWDTLEWPPGEYRLDVEHPHGGIHELDFKKWEEGPLFPKDKIMEMPVVTTQSLSQIETDTKKSAQYPENNDSDWLVYQDGFGREIPNTDQTLREDMAMNLRNLFKKLTSDPGPHLEYEGNFRGGNVIYVEGDLRLSFCHEMGGGECHMYIDVPDQANWEQRTATPLSRRAEILHFVASTVKREKAPSWRYEIGEKEIAYY